MDAPITIKALGRPFSLGMLYDCRNETLIPGITLWSEKSLRENLVVLPQEYSKADVILSDTIQDKAHALDVSAELKLSLLAGMINISGSGNYFKDSTSNSEVARTTLKYTTTRETKQLTMDHLGPGNIQYPNVFDDRTATHVVTMIEYGADAYFVFEKESSDSQNVQKVKGSLRAAVQKLSFAIEGMASVDFSEKEIDNFENIRCSFHGDFQLSQIPTSYRDAADIVRKLPEVIRKCGAVPKMVSLYPLCKLDSKAAKLVRHISVHLIDQVQQFVQSYQDQFAQTGTFLEKQKKADVQVPFIITDTETLKDIINLAMMAFKHDILRIIPKIRGGGKEEIQLTEVLQKWISSSVSPKQLLDILRTIQKTYPLVQARIKEAAKHGVQFLVNEDLDEVLADKEKVLIYEFNSFSMASKKLEIASNSLYSNQIQSVSNDQEWYVSEKNKQEIWDKFKVFLTYMKWNQTTMFIMTESHIENNPSPVRTTVQMQGVTNSINFPSAPGKAFRVPGIEPGTTSISIEWAQPDAGAENVTGYVISYFEADDEKRMKQIEIRGKTETHEVPNLLPATAYRFQIQCKSKAGLSPPGEQSDSIFTSDDNRLALRMLKKSKKVMDKNKKIDIYTPGDRRAIAIGQVEKYEIGNICAMPRFQEKSIIVVGATGTGKTTFINSMINYLFDVSIKDKFRFKLVTQADEGQESSQSLTKKVTAYVLHETKLPYRFTIVDTPGYGDTEGIEADKRTTKLIKDMFERGGNTGIDRLDAVVLVVKASDTRLTACQKHNFNSVFQLFGKDLSDNIFVVSTFSDASEPPVMQTLKDNNIKYTDFFKFNNSAFFQGTGADHFYWEVGQQSFKKLFEGLNAMHPKSLSQSAEVLRKREMLENSVMQLRQNVQSGIANLEEMRKEALVLEKFEAQIKANEDFEYEVEEEVVEQKPITTSGRHTTTCVSCNRTCHPNCAYSDDSDKASCIAMDSNGKCQLCPEKCIWNIHRNLPFLCEVVRKRVTKTNEDLKRKYAEAKGEKYNKETMLENLARQFVEKQEDVLRIIGQINASITKLTEIAHYPRYMTDVDYIDTLIMSEQSELLPGYQDRIAHLTFQRDLADMMQKAQDPNYDPFREYRKANWTHLIQNFESIYGAKNRALCLPGETAKKGRLERFFNFFKIG